MHTGLHGNLEFRPLATLHHTRGRVNTDGKTIVGIGTYIAEMRYDAGDRVRILRNPNGEVVATTYSTNRGLPLAITGTHADTVGAMHARKHILLVCGPNCECIAPLGGGRRQPHHIKVNGGATGRVSGAA